MSNESSTPDPVPESDPSIEQSSEESQRGIAIGSGLSTFPDPVNAAIDAAERAKQHVRAPADLVIGFVTPSFAQRVGMIADAVRSSLSPKHLLIVSAAGIMGNDTEIIEGPGISLLAMNLPGVELHPYTLDATWGPMDPADRASKISQTIGASDIMAASFFFADPFSVPLVNLVPALSASRIEYTDPQGELKRIGTILGGMASGGTVPGGNTLFINGKLSNHGAMGITLSGDIQIDTIISQGCRPIGQPMVVTKARGNLILELGGKPAIEAVRESLQGIAEADRELLEDGLLIGRVINEHKARFGRGDFLIRNILGGDEESGSLAIADLVSAGQTVQPHLHDAQTAHEDLSLLLDAQRLYDRPSAALVVSCTGRTQEFFGQPAHDARAIRHAFELPVDGAKLAKAGRELNAPDTGIPLAGFFAAGEIGPVGSEIFQHGHTVAAALFREIDRVDLK
jgi:small ligand-binding sensory domain FIST